MNLEWLDEEGYPSDKALSVIRDWNPQHRGIIPLLDFVRSLWRFPDYWAEIRNDHLKETIYSISTGGWSGNEDLMEALKDNVVWNFTWVSSSRGEHYTLKVKDTHIKAFPGLYFMKL